jgi:hypothetical protein
MLLTSLNNNAITLNTNPLTIGEQNLAIDELFPPVYAHSFSPPFRSLKRGKAINIVNYDNLFADQLFTLTHTV